MHKYKIFWLFRDLKLLKQAKKSVIFTKSPIDKFLKELRRLSKHEVTLDQWELYPNTDIGSDERTIPGDYCVTFLNNNKNVSTYICNKSCK